MDSQLLYNITQQEAFGIFIAVYFYLTGLSAGSFILSTLAYGFGMEQYKCFADHRPFISSAPYRCTPPSLALICVPEFRVPDNLGFIPFDSLSC